LAQGESVVDSLRTNAVF